MKNIKLYNTFINEQLDIKDSLITIEEFLDYNNVVNLREEIINWWNNNRKRFNIYFFEFNTNEPIIGVFYKENDIYINKKISNNMPNLPNMENINNIIKLYVLFHESRHADQYINNDFEKKYFDTVYNNQEEDFLKNYIELEQDANNFAFDAFNNIGIIIPPHIHFMLKSNENAGKQVFNMMKNDIEKYKVDNIFDLYKKQLL